MKIAATANKVEAFASVLINKIKINAHTMSFLKDIVSKKQIRNQAI